MLRVAGIEKLLRTRRGSKAFWPLAVSLHSTTGHSSYPPVPKADSSWASSLGFQAAGSVSGLSWDLVCLIWSCVGFGGVVFCI